jgi:uncharacterized protein YkwD
MNFIDSLSHYLFPRHSNDHKAKLLHVSSLLLISGFLLSFQLLINYLPRSGVKILGYAANISTDEVIRLTNQKRTEAGVPALRYNSFLSQGALAKGNHMLANQYWAHIAPDGTEPWKFFTDVGYKYRYAGENLARDFTNPQSVVDAWMASPTHRENLLSTKYVDIGVSVVEGNLNGVDTTIIVQFFGTPLGETQPSVAAAKPIITVTPTPPEIRVGTGSAILISPTPIVLPTVLPTAALIESNSKIDTLAPSEKEASGIKVLLSPFQTTRGISIAVTILLIFVFLIDLFVIAKRRLPRSSSRTLAHIAFLGMILAIVVLAKVGKIL